jgi:hypothetical protein
VIGEELYCGKPATLFINYKDYSVMKLSDKKIRSEFCHCIKLYYILMLNKTA